MLHLRKLYCLYNSIYNTIQYSTCIVYHILYNTIQYNTIQYMYSILHTIQYNTIQYMYSILHTIHNVLHNYNYHVIIILQFTVPSVEFDSANVSLNPSAPKIPDVYPSRSVGINYHYYTYMFAISNNTIIIIIILLLLYTVQSVPMKLRNVLINLQIFSLWNG